MAQKKNIRSRQPVAVTRIQVQGLFGHYTYDLHPKDGLEESPPRLLLLYGDNGSGKTTIAQLLFHLLSPKETRGHRTFLARTRFKRFSVTFDTGASLTAERRGKQLEGPFFLVYDAPKKQEVEVPVKTSEDGTVKGGDVDDDELKRMYSLLGHPPLSTYFLSDNRIFQSDVFDEEESDEWMTHRGALVTRRRGDAVERMIVPSPTRTLNVDPSIWRAETWMRRQTLSASSLSEATISNIYAEIIKRIGHAKEAEPKGGVRGVQGLLHSLQTLNSSSQEFVDLGLTSPIPIADLTNALKAVDPTRLTLIASVMEPYVNSVKARLEALAELRRRLGTFLQIINTFYRRKMVNVTVRDGIQVLTEDGDRLEPNALSSGEKQLILLLCNILVGTTQPSLFIIDEPELSLNVKWQRQLLGSLLQLVEGSHVQFVMATHSIELLTRHKTSVVRLEVVKGRPRR